MAFKIVSRKDYSKRGIDTQGQILQVGVSKNYKAIVAADQEAKFWADGKVKITVLDENTLSVSWGIRKISQQMSVAGSGPESLGIMEMIRMNWSNNEEKGFKSFCEVNLDDPYHKIRLPSGKLLIHF